MRRARNSFALSKRFKIFLASFFTVILLFVVAVGFHGVLFPLINSDSSVIDESYVEPVDKATGKINVLILGVDGDRLRTDVIIVASYDLDAGTINMLSIPRDTRMYIGTRYQKINAAHSLTQNGKIKGPQGTIEAVTRLTGIPINYYVEFSFDAFKNTIDALGGVYFDVPQRMKYSDPAQDLYIDLQPGYQLLDGDKAEQFVRFRKYPLGDIARVQAQQNFFKALCEQKLNASILGSIPELYKTLQNDIDTNFTILDAMKYIPNLKELSSENIHMYQLPGDFSGPEYEASYWIANMTELKTLITDVFGYDSSEITNGVKGKSDPVTQNKSQTTTKQNSSTETKATAKPSSSQTSKSETNHEASSPTQKPTATATPKPDDDVINIPDNDDNDDSTDTKPDVTAKPTAKPTPEPDTNTSDKTDDTSKKEESSKKDETSSDKKDNTSSASSGSANSEDEQAQ